MNPVADLRNFGQAVWLDYIRRNIIKNGDLRRYVESDGLRGVTSNPAIFEKAIDGSNDYAEQIAELSADARLAPKDIFEAVAVKDIQDAADVLRPVYDELDGKDGYVSIEVSPDLANDTQATLEEARRLWARVARPNVMVKVPATHAGIPAIQALITEGINVNITLLFAPRLLRSRGARVRRRPAGARRRRPRHRARRERRELLRQPHRHRCRQATWRSAPRRRRAPTGRSSSGSWARWRSRTPSWPT